MSGSLHWSSRPSAGHGAIAYPIIRVKTMPVIGIVLSEQVIGANLHWFKGRSFPHLEPATECEACKAQRPIRWAGYVALWNPQTQAMVIAELTPGVVDQVEQYIQQHTTLRGAQLTLSRPSGKPNGRLAAGLKPGPIPAGQMPRSFDLPAALSRIWELPPTVGQVHPEVMPVAMQILDPAAPTLPIPAKDQPTVKTKPKKPDATEQALAANGYEEDPDEPGMWHKGPNANPEGLRRTLPRDALAGRLNGVGRLPE